MDNPIHTRARYYTGVGQLIYLQQLREKRGYSIRILAKLSGVSTATISRIENGAVDPKASVIRKLATALEVSMDELVPEENKNN
jgi:transcriptional regulator with XRE-family HTH domain